MSQEEYKNSYFSVLKEPVECNETRAMHDYYSILTNNWVQIVVELKQSVFLMVEQYRQSGGMRFLEFPGGVIDTGESPEQAAIRELQEETGYKVKKLTLIGEHYSNPALLKNKIFTFYANQIEDVGEQMLDENENVSIKLISVNDLNKIIKENKNHSLMISSYLLALQHRGFKIS